MLDIREVEQEIAELEVARNHSPSACIYLAALYSIRDHAFGKNDDYQTQYSLTAAPVADHVASAPLERYGNSDFLVIAAGKLPEDAWAVMDDLMDTLKVANPRLYESFMRKMRSL